MIIHDNEAIDNYPFIFHQEVHAGNNDVFIFSLLQQWFLFQVGSSKELRVLSDEGGHSLKLRQVGLISVVGDAYTQKLRHNTNNGVKNNDVFIFSLLQTMVSIPGW